MAGQRRAFGGFLLDAAAVLTEPVQNLHQAIAGRVFKNVGPASEPVRVVHDGIVGAVYGSVRGGFRLAAAGVRVLPLGEPDVVDPAEQSDLALTAQAAINGILGDRMNRDEALTIEMGLVHDRRPLPVEPEALRAAFPQAAPTVVVFIHGLAESERCWWAPAGHKHRVGPSYGDRLAEDLGVTPLYVRYNSGRHISENGARLSALLDQVVTAWPVPGVELVLVGHSMGGLVARSACLQAVTGGHGWVGRVRHVVSLGTPHQGAPLERVVNRASQLLSRVGESKPVADVLELRSDGVRDLRFGYLLEDEWRHSDPAAVRRPAIDPAPNLEGAAHWFVSGSLRPGRHPLNHVLGDLLVTEASAVSPSRTKSGERVEGADTAHFAGLDHLALCNDPAVYAQLRTWLRSRADRRGDQTSR